MMMPEKSQSMRICPVCSAADRILDNERLWPAGWRCPSCSHALVIRAEFPCLAPEIDGADVGFDPTAFTTLARMEGGHFWFQVRNELIAWLVHRYGATAKRILEIGCGTGFVLDAIRAACPSASIVGSELHSAGLTVARGRHGGVVELIQADARRLCLRNALDVVCALDVLEHIEKDEEVLKEIEAALRPGGFLIAAVPQHPWLWSESDDLSHHVRRYRVGEIERKAKVAGFDLRFADSFVSLLLPVMAMRRLTGRIWPRRTRRADPAGTLNDPLVREFGGPQSQPSNAGSAADGASVEVRRVAITGRRLSGDRSSEAGLICRGHDPRGQARSAIGGSVARRLLSHIRICRHAFHVRFGS